jgi:hypothetical protein
MPRSPAPTRSFEPIRLALKILLTTAYIAAAVLVVLLVVAAVAPGSDAFGALAGLYAFGYVYLVYLALTGARREMWDWRLPLFVLVTGGAIGAIVGGLRLRGALDRAEAAATRKRPRKRR